MWSKKAWDVTTTASYSNPQCKALRIGSRFHEACLKSVCGEVQSVFTRVVNISANGELLALALPEVGGSSRFLTLRSLDFLRSIESGDICRLEPTRLTIGSFVIDLTDVPLWQGPLSEVKRMSHMSLSFSLIPSEARACPEGRAKREANGDPRSLIPSEARSAESRDPRG